MPPRLNLALVACTTPGNLLAVGVGNGFLQPRGVLVGEVRAPLP